MRFWRPKVKGEERTLDEPLRDVGTGAVPPVAAPRSRRLVPDATGDAPPPGVVSAPGAATAAPGLMRVAVPSLASPGGPPGNTRLSREVRRLLAALGPTSGAVAASLEAAGVRAAPKVAEHTPITAYLSAVIGADPNVKSVEVDGQSVVVELRAWWRPAVVVDLPPAVREFTTAFDQCCYPGLLPPGHPAG